jgi:hypothetical protein
MSVKNNPIEEIYKCSILNRNEGAVGGVPKCILVFYGVGGGGDIETPSQISSSLSMSSQDLTRLYNDYLENGTNSKLFENIFSKMELRNIATYDIQVYMINFKIYSDDSIDVTKRKIMLAIKSVIDGGGDIGSNASQVLPQDYAYDEMYLFAKTPVTFDSNDVYHKMIEREHQQDKNADLDFLKTHLIGYSSNSSLPIDIKDNWNNWNNGSENILSRLKSLNAKNIFQDVPIGQSIPSNTYANPFFLE